VTAGQPASHAVARLRATRLAASTKPFVTRGSATARCSGCRLMASHCLCALRPVVSARAGVCLIMADIEPLKPSNTGWLIADLVADTWAFGWSRVAVDPALISLLADPLWQPYVVFPGEYVAPERVVSEVAVPAAASDKRPLFVLLDGTWSEARKMFRRSPYLDRLPVLSLQPGHASIYRLRRALHAQHFCTSEVAAQCLALAGDTHAADTLAAYLDVFTTHYLSAKRNLRLDRDSEAHQQLARLAHGAQP
jgi:DTW domain-containing protein YfiP